MSMRKGAAFAASIQQPWIAVSNPVHVFPGSQNRCSSLAPPKSRRRAKNCTLSPRLCVTSVESSISPAILVVDHGSRRQAANETLNEVIRIVRQRSRGVPIYAAHMELANPTIAEAFEAAVAGGANHVVVVPFFLAAGRHVTSDIPALVGAAAEAHPGVTFDVRSPIGTHPAIADVVMERAGVVVTEV